MQLETIMEAYQPKASRERQQTYFVVGDLESLSASALYMADKLYIKDFIDGSSLHIHENDDEIVWANIRGKGEKKGEGISNYEAVMLDILPGKVTIKSGS